MNNSMWIWVGGFGRGSLLGFWVCFWFLDFCFLGGFLFGWFWFFGFCFEGAFV